eukprot:TRINITY_DN8634_c0_g1_i1.p1 TRINITY_DN8634_c0_g1~~TRINITY_DN8634_c0_g1_i1.p1  ORF type:complete len:290 (-),score=48.09 TRINITY_DN8634_c0_g1_i1:63-932(-)
MQDLDDVLAAQPANWAYEEKRQAYHCLMGGYYVDALVRRVDPQHRHVRQFIADEIATPLGVEFYGGFGKNEDKATLSRMSRQYRWPSYHLFPRVLSWSFVFGQNEKLYERFWGEPLPVDAAVLLGVNNASSAMSKACMNHMRALDLDPTKSELFWQVEGPAFAAKANSHTLAKIAAMVGHGGEIGGVRILKPETVRLLSEHLDERFDEALGRRMLMLKGGFKVWSASEDEDAQFVGWGGNGGSVILWHPTKDIAVSYVMNGMNNRMFDPRATALVLSTYHSALASTAKD